MKITEMNNCIGKMRKCYKFDDDKTDIWLGDIVSKSDRCVTVCTVDENGTQIEMSRHVDELKEKVYE